MLSVAVDHPQRESLSSLLKGDLDGAGLALAGRGGVFFAIRRDTISNILHTTRLWQDREYA